VDLALKLFERLGIPVDRAKTLLNDVFKVAAKWYREERDLLVLDRVDELLNLAKSKEEAYLVGIVALMIQTDVRIATDPTAVFGLAIFAPKTIETIEKIGDRDESRGSC